MEIEMEDVYTRLMRRMMEVYEREDYKEPAPNIAELGASTLGERMGSAPEMG